MGNQSNHALRLSNQSSSSRNSFLGGSRSSGGGSLRQAERAALCPIHAALADPRLKCREISWKSADRGWICAKRWREREFYLMLDGPSVFVVEVSGGVCPVRFNTLQEHFHDVTV